MFIPSVNVDDVLGHLLNIKFWDCIAWLVATWYRQKTTILIDTSLICLIVSFCDSASMGDANDHILCKLVYPHLSLSMPSLARIMMHIFVIFPFTSIHALLYGIDPKVSQQ